MGTHYPDEPLLYGDEGLYISSWYSLLFTPFFYFVGFPLMGMVNPLPSKVVMIESFMPTAIIAVVLTKIFDLNNDLSNAAWFTTTFLFIRFLPALFYVQKLL